MNRGKGVTIPALVYLQATTLHTITLPYGASYIKAVQLVAFDHAEFPYIPFPYVGNVLLDLLFTDVVGVNVDVEL